MRGSQMMTTDDNRRLQMTQEITDENKQTNDDNSSDYEVRY